MKILNNNEIDLKKWDETVLHSAMPLVFAQSFYLDATSPGWKALIEGDYKSVMPVTSNKKFGISYLTQPPFTPQLGIFGKYNEDVAKEFLEELKKDFKYISIELNASNTFSSSETKEKLTFIIEPGKEYKYNSNTKRNIAKAKKAGLKVNEVFGKEILSLSKKYLNPFLKKKLKIDPGQIKMFDQLVVNSINGDHIKTFIIIDEKEKVCGIAHFIFNEFHAVYLKGANFDRNSGSMHLLMDHAIEFFRNNKIRMFDFGGGQNESLAQFYSGLGGEPLNYKIYKVNNLPKAIKWLKK